VPTTRDERLLARARVLLSAASLVAIYLDPTEPSRFASVAYGLLLLYLAGSAWLVVQLRTGQVWPPWTPFAIHLVDMLWIGVLTSVTGASSSPLFPFLTFVVLAAAYRWDFKETMATAATLSVLLFVQAYALASWGSSDTNLRFELNRFIVRAAYMMIAGVLLAYLASYQKRLRLESAVVARLLSNIHSETGLARALDIAARELLLTFGARSLTMVIRDADVDESVAWALSSSAQDELQRVHLAPGDEPRYLFDASAAFALKRRGDHVQVTTAVDGGDTKTPKPRDEPLLAPPVAFTRAIAATISFEDTWSGRVFLFDPEPRHTRAASLGLFHRIVSTIVPALHGLHLIGRLRSRAEAAERARLARDLHDTSIQSLIGIELELMVLGRRTADATLRTAIGDVQSRLRSEIQALRRLIIGPAAEIDAVDLTQRLTETLAQFQIDTHIRARFASVSALSVPARLSREIVLLLQAALSNVERHSEATRVDVTFEREGEVWRLVIEDDGRGFRDGNKFADMHPAKTPWSVRARVNALGGQLLVEPREGAGLRVEIRLPRAGVPA
jgi:signal transduction histidine kinase